MTTVGRDSTVDNATKRRPADLVTHGPADMGLVRRLVALAANRLDERSGREPGELVLVRQCVKSVLESAAGMALMAGLAVATWHGLSVRGLVAFSGVWAALVLVASLPIGGWCGYVVYRQEMQADAELYGDGEPGEDQASAGRSGEGLPGEGQDPDRD